MIPAIQKVLKSAEAEIGYLEKASNKDLDPKIGSNVGRNDFTKYARDLDKLKTFNTPKQGFDWCQLFVVFNFYRCFGLDTALKMLYLTQGGDGAGCTQAANHYKAHKAFFGTPQAGDQIFFTNGAYMVHTGIVVKVEGGYVVTIEGNTSYTAGVVANGGGVNRKKYPLAYNRIAGYGRPDWSLAEQEDDTMTGEQIYKALNDYCATLPLPEWAVRDFNAAIAAGITDGSNPMQLVPRYQAAIMAYRAMRKDGE